MANYLFSLYRYQILPIDTQFSMIYSLNTLIEKKNELFANELVELKNENTNNARRKYRIEIIKRKGEKYVLIISREKNVKYYRKDYTRDSVSSFPPAYILIDNDKQSQIIAVQNTKEYQSQKTLVSVLMKRILPKLAKENLCIKYSPIYKKNGFWNFINEHKGDVLSVLFEIITPNMSSISANLSEDIARMAKETQAVTTEYKITAGKGSTLNISENNKDIDGLVDYTAKGGGETKVKIRNSKSHFNTNDFQIKTEVSEIEMTGNLDELFTIIQEAARGADR